jgi:hypothetical protein
LSELAFNYDRYLRIVSATSVIAEREDGRQLSFTLSGGADHRCVSISSFINWGKLDPDRYDDSVGYRRQPTKRSRKPFGRGTAIAQTRIQHRQSTHSRHRSVQPETGLHPQYRPVADGYHPDITLSYGYTASGAIKSDFGGLLYFT